MAPIDARKRIAAAEFHLSRGSRAR